MGKTTFNVCVQFQYFPKMSYLKSIKKKNLLLIFNVFQRPGRNVILPRVAHAPHGEGIKLMWWKREKEREGRMNGGDLLRAETDWEVKLKADGRAGTCRTLKSVWSRFPHVFFFSLSFCVVCQKTTLRF